MRRRSPRAIAAALADPAALRNETLTLRARVQADFSADVMADAVLAAYGEALARFRRDRLNKRSKLFLNLLR